MSLPEKTERVFTQAISRRKPSLIRRLSWRALDAAENINWLHVAFKICAYTYIAFIIWITWQLLPLPGHWAEPIESDRIPVVYQDVNNYFEAFEGFYDCGIRLDELYKLPQSIDDRDFVGNAFCPDRKTLLTAMSNGGRTGFDARYNPRDCYYRWYTVEEICHILDRFESIIFVGDSFLQAIYNGLNVLLRRSLASGAMKSYKENCRCESQFLNPDCAADYVKSSKDVNDYFCSRTPHAMISITNVPQSEQTVARFRELIPEISRSRYRPIPIVYSVSPSTLPSEVAGKALLEFLKLANQSKRKTPMLWIGPTAAGHVDVKHRKGNQEIWDFDKHVASLAHENDVEVLKMWNLTVQANSQDGLHFGERVALVQAMMVVNWLSRLASS